MYIQRNRMKLFSIFLLMAFFSSVNGQISDTLVYVKSFEVNKINYIGDSFSNLLNNMTQLQPTALFTNTSKYSLIKFTTTDEWFNTGTVNMVVFWQTPIPVSESEYYENKNSFHFTIDERNFYGSKIVKNIYVYTTK